MYYNIVHFVGGVLCNYQLTHGWEGHNIFMTV